MLFRSISRSGKRCFPGQPSRLPKRDIVFIHRLKLRAPQRAASWVDRPALEERLRTAAGVTTIVAGPGYGKTMLAARAIADWQGPSLWYSLDESDADLAVFAAHLDAGLRAWRMLRSTTASIQPSLSTLCSKRSAMRRLSVTFKEPAVMSARYRGPAFSLGI